MAPREWPVPDTEAFRSRMARARKVARYFFATGGLLMVISAGHWWLVERTFARMRITTCVVVSRKIEAETLVSGTGRRPRGPSKVSLRENAYLTLAHTVDGRRYVFSEEFIYDWSNYAHLGFKEGQSQPCRYDPENPANATIRDEVDSTRSGNIFAFGILAFLLGWFIPGGVKLAAQNAEMRRRP